MAIVQQPKNISVHKLTRGDCPYCKTPLKNAIELVQCVSCKTVHHASCWAENNNRCSIFGCQNSLGINYVIHQRHALLKLVYYLGLIANGAFTVYVTASAEANLLAPLLMVIVWGLWVGCFRFLCNAFIYCPRCNQRVRVSRSGIRLQPPDNCPNCNIAFF